MSGNASLHHHVPAESDMITSPARFRLTLAMMALWLGTSGCHAGAPRPPEVLADSVDGFSGVQGQGGWSYGYWDRTGDPDGVYDPAGDFGLLGQFGTDPINGLSNHSEFETGELWSLEDGVYYTSLWAEGGHPHGTMDLGSYARAEHWVVRRWVSSTEGRIEVSGHAGKVMPWGENWSGGVQARIVVDGETVYAVDVDDGGAAYSVSARVQVGSLVDFLIGPGPAIGVIRFTATITGPPDEAL